MNTEKASGVRMRELVTAVGGPVEAGENRKSYLVRVASSAAISFRAAKAAFYGEPTSKKIAQKLREAAGKNEAKQLAARFEGLARSLDVRDADFHSADVAALLDAARALRGLDRP